MASTSANQVLSSAVARLLRPLVRVLLSNGFSFKSFVELARRTYVDVAMSELAIPGKKQTASRVSILTGLTRKEVQRIQKKDAALETSTGERYNRAARVITGWIRDSEFAEASGEPSVLPIEDANKGFNTLVRRYSGDMPARAVLDELLRVGAVERTSDGRIRLVARAYVPRASQLDKLGILGTDVADLIQTIDHNLEESSSGPYFQRKVMYDNLPAEIIEEFRALSAKQAQQLLEQLDGWLAKRDRDASPTTKGTGRVRAGIGVYYFAEDVRMDSQGQ
jgi:hypothetical protein